MRTTARRIGVIGTSLRALFGLGLVYLAFADPGKPLALGIEWWEIVLGLLAFPAAMLLIGLAATRYAHGPLRLTGPVPLLINTAALVALLSVPETRDAAFLFYGVSLLVAAWRALPDCEITVLSNLILGRDDQIGCPVFSPIDHAEASTLGSKAA